MAIMEVVMVIMEGVMVKVFEDIVFEKMVGLNGVQDLKKLCIAI